MNAAIGIDGGGTKTAFVIGNETEIFYQIEKRGCSYLEIGKEAVVDLIVSGVKELLERCPDAVCDGCCLVMVKTDRWMNGSKELYAKT